MANRGNSATQWRDTFKDGTRGYRLGRPVQVRRGNWLGRLLDRLADWYRGPEPKRKRRV